MPAARKRKRREEKPLTVQKTDRELTPKRGETVAFEVLCRSRTGGGLQEMMSELALDAIERSSPEERTLADVARTLIQQGFHVFMDDACTSVSAQGPYDLFEKAFQTKLRKRGRTL